MSDPAGQFEWMDGVLTSASMAKEKVRTLKLPCSTKFLQVLISVFGYCGQWAYRAQPIMSSGR